MTLEGIKYYLEDPKRWYAFFASRNLLNWMSDKAFLKMAFRMNMGKQLDLKEPKTYSEKLQWLKLYDRKPIYTELADKYAVRKHIAAAIGEEHLIPLIGGPWKSFDEINFDSLPEQFVLKCTHDSGGLVICTDKAKLDIKAARKKIEKSLKTNYFWRNREWPYKDIKPQVIAEKYMEDAQTADLRDYKFFCFDGEVKALFIATERQSKDTETRFDFFDADFNHLDLRNGHPNADVLPKKPEHFEEMKALAAKLSEGIPQARIDLYEVNGRIYFGEVTFFHWSGMVAYEPEEWDYTFGSWLTLPDKKIS